MNANDSQILQALERLGAQYAWDTVAIWIERDPGGQVRFTAYIPHNYDRDVVSAFGHGATLAEACADLSRVAGVRDPEAMREKKLAELRQNIAKLEAANFGPPPYRPGSLLGPGALNVDIEV